MAESREERLQREEDAYLFKFTKEQRATITKSIKGKNSEEACKEFVDGLQAIIHKFRQFRNYERPNFIEEPVPPEPELPGQTHAQLQELSDCVRNLYFQFDKSANSPEQWQRLEAILREAFSRWTIHPPVVDMQGNLCPPPPVPLFRQDDLIRNFLFDFDAAIQKAVLASASEIKPGRPLDILKRDMVQQVIAAHFRYLGRLPPTTVGSDFEAVLASCLELAGFQAGKVHSLIFEARRTLAPKKVPKPRKK